MCYCSLPEDDMTRGSGLQQTKVSARKKTDWFSLEIIEAVLTFSLRLRLPSK